MARDYAIVPEEEVNKLKSDMEKLKKNPLQSYGSDDLIEAMSNLTKAINSMTELFKTAAEEMKFEERETETIGRKMDPMFSKIDMLLDQNQKIARGVVAVADMLSEKPAPSPAPRQETTISSPSMGMQMPQRPMAPMQGPSGSMSPQRMAGNNPPMVGQGPMPPGMARPPMPPSGMPAPPPVKKKGMFG